MMKYDYYRVISRENIIVNAFYNEKLVINSGKIVHVKLENGEIL
jgi:hypothetical protein